MSKLTKAQRNLVSLVAADPRGLDHDDERLSPYCDRHSPLDVFNDCHKRGWLRTAHDVDTSVSIVHVTPAGREALREQS